MYKSWQEVMESQVTLPLYDKEWVKKTLEDRYGPIKKRLPVVGFYFASDADHMPGQADDAASFILAIHEIDGQMEDQGYSEPISELLFADLADVFELSCSENLNWISFETLAEKFDDFPSDNNVAYEQCREFVVRRVSESLKNPQHVHEFISGEICLDYIIADLTSLGETDPVLLERDNWTFIQDEDFSGIIDLYYKNKKTNDSYLIVMCLDSISSVSRLGTWTP